MKKFLMHSMLLLGLAFGWALPSFAQTCSISSTFSSAGTGSTACFTKAGNVAVVQISNTWVGTVKLQWSTDTQTWFDVASYTANTVFTTPVMPNDVRWRLFPYAYTSGTVTYTITDSTAQLGRIKYSNIEVGPVAYASLGTSTAGSSTVTMSTDVFVGADKTITGIGILVGATGGTDKFVLILRDSQCRVLGSTDTAGTTVSSSTNAFQEIALTSPVAVARGRYYIDVQTNGTTATTRRIATATYINVTAAEVNSTTFGTVPTYGTCPTTFTALKAPVVYVY